MDLKVVVVSGRHVWIELSSLHERPNGPRFVLEEAPFQRCADFQRVENPDPSPGDPGYCVHRALGRAGRNQRRRRVQVVLRRSSHRTTRTKSAKPLE